MSAFLTIGVSLLSFFTGKNNVVAIAGVLLALVILVLVGVAVICSQKKQKNDKPKGTKPNFPFPDSLRSCCFFDLSID